jgi:hypothetical protein
VPVVVLQRDGGDFFQVSRQQCYATSSKPPPASKPSPSSIA